MGSLYCSTFKRSNYSYTHNSGQVSYSVRVNHLRGMAGILQLGESHGGDITASFNREVVVKALQWLRKNNPIYSDFLAQLETLYAYFPRTSVNSVGTPFPTVTSDIQVGSGKQLTAEDIKSKEGMIILADPTEQLSLGQLKPSEVNKLLERAGVESRRIHN